LGVSQRSTNAATSPYSASRPPPPAVADGGRVAQAERLQEAAHVELAERLGRRERNFARARGQAHR
jgi:hypothetical protein